MYAAVSLDPAVLEALEPAPAPCSEEYGVCGEARRLSKACVEAYSAWFLAMRAPMGRERDRQAALRESLGLSKKAKVDRRPPEPTEAELAVARVCEGMVRAMFGDSAADYARECFDRAMSTGDMRAFKIRLLVLRARDSLEFEPLQEAFRGLQEECISEAEAKAGCVACPGPRRMSRAEQERKRLREERAAANGPSGDHAKDGPEATPPEASPEANPEGKLKEKPKGVSGGEANKEPDKKPEQAHDNAGIKNTGAESACDKVESPTLKPLAEGLNGDMCNISIGAKDKASCQFTKNSSNAVQSNGSIPEASSKAAPVRAAQSPKAKSQGRYDTSEKILDAMKRGEISPGKAVLLMAELDDDLEPLSGKPTSRPEPKPKPRRKEQDLASLANEIEAKEFGGGSREDDGDDDREMVDDDYRYDSDAGRDGSAYNTGRYRYSSCFGGYNASGSEWCPDDDF